MVETKPGGISHGQFLLWTLLCRTMEHRSGSQDPRAEESSVSAGGKGRGENAGFTDCQFPTSYQNEVPSPFHVTPSENVPMCGVTPLRWTELTAAPRFPELDMAWTDQDGKATLSACVNTEQQALQCSLEEARALSHPDGSPLPVLAGLSGKAAWHVLAPSAAKDQRVGVPG